MQLQIDRLRHTYPGHPTRPALDTIQLHVPSGQFVALIGPSGCGKSTLLRLIGSLLPITDGDIRLDGDCTPEQAAGQGQVAWMSQSPALLPWLTARANVALAQRFLPNGSRPRFSPEEALARVDLLDHAGAYPHSLSGGMQQRLALARLLTLHARLWLMDEPFAALDELTRERLAVELFELWQPLRPTVLWVTHNIYEAVRLAQRVVVFSPRPGRLVADLPVELPYPRREDWPAFQKVVRQVRAALALAAEAR
jgi:NitT/TauT family transport system ATP-binding protein